MTTEAMERGRILGVEVRAIDYVPHVGPTQEH
jgi:hypothetical protein